MNERIRELIDQATIRGEEYLPGNDGHPTPTVYFDKEKFAELIVKECMVISKTWEDQLEKSKQLSESNAVGIVTYRISRQFGVEE